MKNSTYFVASVILAVFCLIQGLQADRPVNGDTPRKCYSCQGINCQRTTRANATSSCSDLLDICVTVFDGFAVKERGCFLDLSIESRAKCEAETKQDNAEQQECHKCNGELCNDKGRAMCVQCKGSDDSKCNTAARSLNAALCGVPTAPNSYCYVRQANAGNVERGCALSVEESVNCLADKSCSLCLAEAELGASACNTYELEGPKSSATKLNLSLAALLSFFLTVKLFN